MTPMALRMVPRGASMTWPLTIRPGLWQAAVVLFTETVGMVGDEGMAGMGVAHVYFMENPMNMHGLGVQDLKI